MFPAPWQQGGKNKRFWLLKLNLGKTVCVPIDGLYRDVIISILDRCVPLWRSMSTTECGSFLGGMHGVERKHLEEELEKARCQAAQKSHLARLCAFTHPFSLLELLWWRAWHLLGWKVES